MAEQPTYSALESRPLKDTICLFDVDNTLTPARGVREPNQLDESLDAYLES